MTQTIRNSNDSFIILTFSFSSNATNNIAEVANSISVACARVQSMLDTKDLHAQMLIDGRFSIHNVVSWTALINLYIKYDTVQEARECLTKYPNEICAHGM